MATNNAINSGLSGSTGSGSFVGSNSPNITTPNTIGVINGSNAATGSVGEVISSVVTGGTPVAMTSGIVTNITTILLSAGDWNVSGVISADFSAATTSVSNIVGAINTISANLPQVSAGINTAISTMPASAGNSWIVGTQGTPTVVIGSCRISVSSATTVYLIARLIFSVSTGAIVGTIMARRVR